MLAILIRIVVAYLLGSLMGGLIVGRLRGGVDIRTQGSGNAGGTNALRTQGKGFAFWVMLIDVGKGLVAAGVVPWFPIPFLHATQAGIGLGWIAALCGMAVIVGHVWPVFFSFRGGKGMATYVGVLVVLAPLAFVIALAVWLLVLVLSGFVGLATLLAVWVAPVYLLVTASGFGTGTFWFALLTALFILYTHRGNIARMRAGTENRFTRVMLLRRGHG
ncbi:MAG TPA: glycerol-3-phosphate 1-O-acyltransferase PlsY [Gammaproteobacteria bacterium]|nr:glycerol-3-phosphate 1-O-acyltransferase PlsY [Gammaproteobacteria bacterium]